MKRLYDIQNEHLCNVQKINAKFLDYRCYGDAKIKKPTILKGLKPIHKFKIIGENAEVYEVDEKRLIIHFRELFCQLASFPEPIDMALPASALTKKYNLKNKSYKSFIYPDAWCTIYNRNEGYVLIENLQPCFEELYGIRISPIVDRVYKELRDLSTKDARFLTLGLEPIGANSCDYYRLCSDLVEYFYKRLRDKHYDTRTTNQI